MKSPTPTIEDALTEMESVMDEMHTQCLRDQLWRWAAFLFAQKHPESLREIIVEVGGCVSEQLSGAGRGAINAAHMQDALAEFKSEASNLL